MVLAVGSGMHLAACKSEGSGGTTDTTASAAASNATTMPPAVSPPPPARADADAGARRVIVLKAAHLVDGVAPARHDDFAVLIDGERIAAVGPSANIVASATSDARVIDLGSATLLPGLIDAHTHILLHGDVTAADYDEQLLKESIPFRTIGATMAVRTALGNGFTALRDLETEGAMYADVDVKRAIARGIIPGPRLFVATRAFAPTGTYPLSGYSWELQVPEGVQIVDGADNLRHAVREQVKYGADWIKYYADRRYYLPPERDCKHELCSWVNYSDEEARAIVMEAHRLGKRVAAHAIGWDGIDAALRAGVDTIEHGDGLDDGLIDRMVAQHVYWCPTLYVGIWVSGGRGGVWPKLVELEKVAFQKALKKGARIAYGTDVGGYPWTENQAKELSVMVRYGMAPMAAIQSATRVAASLLEQDKELGTLEKGKLADIVAVRNDPLADISELERVTFVMKGGAVFKGEGADTYNRVANPTR